MGRSPFWNWLQYLMYCCKLWTQCSTDSHTSERKKEESSEKKGKVQEDRPVHAGKSFTS